MICFRLNAFGLEVEAEEEDDISDESDSGSSPPSSDISTSSFDSRFVPVSRYQLFVSFAVYHSRLEMLIVVRKCSTYR